MYSMKVRYCLVALVQVIIIVANPIQAMDHKVTQSIVQYHDVIITEVMADPMPAVMLPDAEYIELLNRTNSSIVLQGYFFRINDKDYAFGSGIIEGKERVIVCHRDDSLSFSPFGKVLPMNKFPNLPKNNLHIELRNTYGQLVDHQYLTDEWFISADKQSGGWSLEMIDVSEPCLEKENWHECTNAIGGTPGQKNSIEGSITEQYLTEVAYVSVENDTTLHIGFTRKMDSSVAVNCSNYSLLPNSSNIKKALLQSPLFKVLEITLDAPFIETFEYNLQLSHELFDCQHQALSGSYSFSFAFSGPSRSLSCSALIPVSFKRSIKRSS